MHAAHQRQTRRNRTRRQGCGDGDAIGAGVQLINGLALRILDRADSFATHAQLHHPKTSHLPTRHCLCDRRGKQGCAKQNCQQRGVQAHGLCIAKPPAARKRAMFRSQVWRRAGKNEKPRAVAGRGRKVFTL